MIPEAHCFLRHGQTRVDVTRALPEQSRRSIPRFVYEEVISPDQIGEYKNGLHRRFLREWIARRPRAASYTLDPIWRIREECIAALAETGGTRVRGTKLDAQTRCEHFHGPTDIVAIKMKCCGVYYACKDCHAALADHAIEVWPEAEWNQKAILCGACQLELSIREYMRGGSRCVHCGAPFNPKCQNHYHFYFDCKQPAPKVSPPF